MEDFKYDFDSIINRKGTNTMSLSGYRGYLFEVDEDLTGKYSEADFIPMWVADMEFAIAPEILEAMRKRLDHPLLGYSVIASKDYPLAFQQWCLDRYHWKIDLDHLVQSKGVVPALMNLIGLICKTHEKVLIVTPSYAFFKHSVDFNGVELMCSELINEEGQYRMNLSEIEVLASDENCVLALFCNPHNPTGRVWSDKELIEFGRLCLDNDLTIISDEIHCDLLRKEQRFTPLAKLFPSSDRIITCMAPSKTFNLAGNLFANLILPNPKLRNRYTERYLPIENPLSIVAAEAAYKSGHQWLAQLTDYLDDNFQYLKAQLALHLPHAVFVIPESTYLAWINVKYYFSSEENLTLWFARHAGVLLEGGEMFVANAEGYIRLNLACPRLRLEEGVTRIIEAILEK